jgi:hypothetical protein
MWCHARAIPATGAQAAAQLACRRGWPKLVLVVPRDIGLLAYELDQIAPEIRRLIGPRQQLMHPYIRIRELFSRE